MHGVPVHALLERFIASRIVTATTVILRSIVRRCVRSTLASVFRLGPMGFGVIRF